MSGILVIVLIIYNIVLGYFVIDTRGKLIETRSWVVQSVGSVKSINGELISLITRGCDERK